MKKFVNNVDEILTESLTGFGNAHSDILEVNLKPDFVDAKIKLIASPLGQGRKFSNVI